MKNNSDCYIILNPLFRIDSKSRKKFKTHNSSSLQTNKLNDESKLKIGASVNSVFLNDFIQINQSTKNQILDFNGFIGS